MFKAINISLTGEINASEEVKLNLISAKSIPCLLYASEALSLNPAQLKSLNFSAKRVLLKYLKLIPLTLYLIIKNSSIFPMSLN